MSTPATDPGTDSLTERYVYAATRALPEDQREDVAEELRGSIADRVDSLMAQRPGTSAVEAEYAAVTELGDPSRLAAGYSGRPLHLIGPELYPPFVRVLKMVLAVSVPTSMLVSALVSASTGSDVGGIVGHAVWLAVTVVVQVCFWVTALFVLVERGVASSEVRSTLDPGWSPERLREARRSDRDVGELVASIAWIVFLAAALVWQYAATPIHSGGEHAALLDPDLWSFWLPLVLVLLALEAGLEVVKYRSPWTPALAAVNAVCGAAFAAPFVYLAVSDQLLNPRAVDLVQRGWADFDPHAANVVVIVVALAIWATDAVAGARRACAIG